MNRLTTTLTYRLAVLIVGTATIGYAWYDLLTPHGPHLDQMDGRTGAACGLLYVASCAWVAGQVLAWCSRRWPRPLPVDPENPPEKVLFVQVDGEEPACCDCHGRPVKDNAEIWLWPQPTKIICVSEDDRR